MIPVLIKAGIGPTQARTYGPHLESACARFNITGRALAMFLAQVAHETQGLTRMEENLYYTSASRIRGVFTSRVKTLADAAQLVRNPQALAEAVYGGRLGNTKPGHGWAYRGRGMFQLTGWSNYSAAGVALSRPYIDRPELVAEPEDAALTAAWFFADRGCLRPAADGDIRGCTKPINPALAGIDERLKLYRKFTAALA